MQNTLQPQYRIVFTSRKRGVNVVQVLSIKAEYEMQQKAIKQRQKDQSRTYQKKIARQKARRIG